jgi:hypothetical protein
MNEETWIRELSAQDFAGLGMNQIAYIRVLEGEGEQKEFAIHAADGQRLTVAPTREAALVIILRNDLEPVTVH